MKLLHPAAIRWDILGRTAGYSLAVAIIAVVLAFPAAIVIGRGGRTARLVAFALPLTLLLPSLMYAYGWAQFFRLLAPPMGRWLVSTGVSTDTLERVGVMVRTFGPDAPSAWLIATGPADVARCVLSLACWLWPIPAAAMAWALRRADPSVRQQALLDGVARRMTLRQTLAPALVSALAVWVLASQEFAVYEPTGISVVSTEVRQVFQTGQFSSGENPITQPMGGGMFIGQEPAGSTLPSATAEPIDVQQRAAAAAVATGVPMLVLTGLFGVIIARTCRRWAIESDELGEQGARDANPESFSQRKDASVSRLVPGTCAFCVVLLTVGVPIAAMALRHQRSVDLLFIWRQSGEFVLGSLFVAALAGVAVLPMSFAGLIRRPGIGLAVALATFLVGGLLLAIALIRLYNQRSLGWVYNAPPIMILAYLGRFGWLALLASMATWSRPWRLLRAQAAVDGASTGAIAFRIVWPLAWPLIIGSAGLVLVLSLTEVPATMLASPHRPLPQIVPMLMTWVHTLESDPMIESSLLLAGVVVVLSSVVVWMIRRLRVEHRGSRIEDRELTLEKRGPKHRYSPLSILCPLSSLLFLLISGCGDGGKPDEVWLGTGTAAGQVVYPRAISYSPKDDTFFVVDRVARIQHIDRDGKHLNGWQMPEWQVGKPVGLTVGPDGNLYVPDTHYHRVMVYTPQGQLVRQWGSLGKENGQFIYPTDVAFDEQGRVFVSEYGDNDRVQVFDGAGNFLFHFGSFGNGDGNLARPQSMVIVSGHVYLTDSSNHRIAVFKTDGTFVRNMGAVGSELGQFRFPYGLDLDPKGRLVVTEFGNNRVQLVDRDTGQGIKIWGAAGRDLGQLAYPWASACDKKGRVVTVDSGNNRLQVFGF